MAQFVFCVSLSHKHPGKYDITTGLLRSDILCMKMYMLNLDIWIFSAGWSRNEIRTKTPSLGMLTFPNLVKNYSF